MFVSLAAASSLFVFSTMFTTAWIKLKNTEYSLDFCPPISAKLTYSIPGNWDFQKCSPVCVLLI